VTPVLAYKMKRLISRQGGSTDESIDRDEPTRTNMRRSSDEYKEVGDPLSQNLAGTSPYSL
jgi:hypothetical protein